MRAFLTAAIFALTPALATAAPAPTATATATAAEAAIPFPDSNTIRNWQATARDTLYIEGPRRQWYRATLMSPCLDLPFTETIGFETRGTPTFDRFSSIVVRGQRCPLTSLVRSSPPPKAEPGKSDHTNH
jgi:hypothetical protein